MSARKNKRERDDEGVVDELQEDHGTGGDVNDDGLSTSKRMGAFHSIMKRLHTATTAEQRAAAQAALDDLGGLRAYQQLSLSGEVASDFDSSVWVKGELQSRGVTAKPIRLLDVGAIRPRYGELANVQATSIDLLSQHEGVQQIDFFDFAKKNAKPFDVIVLSLVLNFVGSAEQRGEMLAQCARHLKPGGLFFLVLPEPALSNSRYMKFGVLRKLLRRVGLPIADQEKAHKTSDKLFFCVCQRDVKVEKEVAQTGASKALFKRVVCRGGDGRNNFAILLGKAFVSEERQAAMPAQPRSEKPTKREKKIFFNKEDPNAPKKASTSNQRKRARMRKKREMRMAASNSQTDTTKETKKKDSKGKKE